VTLPATPGGMSYRRIHGPFVEHIEKALPWAMPPL
jgi:hypothetical protein